MKCPYDHVNNMYCLFFSTIFVVLIEFLPFYYTQSDIYIYSILYTQIWWSNSVQFEIKKRRKPSEKKLKEIFIPNFPLDFAFWGIFVGINE